MLTDKDKKIIKTGTFHQKMHLIMEHPNDLKWLEEHNDYVKKLKDDRLC